MKSVEIWLPGRCWYCELCRIYCWWNYYDVGGMNTYLELLYCYQDDDVGVSMTFVCNQVCIMRMWHKDENTFPLLHQYKRISGYYRFLLIQHFSFILSSHNLHYFYSLSLYTRLTFSILFLSIGFGYVHTPPSLNLTSLPMHAANHQNISF